jgi:peptidoglycan hydrolase-like protein with peptidoglycan-binding domain
MYFSRSKFLAATTSTLELEEKMLLKGKIVLARVMFTFLVTGMLGLSLTSLASAVDPSEEKPAVLHHQDIKKVQESLRDKGYYTGKVDGVLGPRTRKGIRQYQKSENLPVTGKLDAETAGKLGVGPESIGGHVKGAGHEVVEGGKEAGHEMKKGKPIAAGKEMGKGIGRGGEEVGEAAKKAVSPESDRGDRETKEQTEKQDNPK